MVFGGWFEYDNELTASKVFLGDSDIQPGPVALYNFVLNATDLIAQTSRLPTSCPEPESCPSGPPEREEVKLAFKILMRAHMWVPTCLGAIYVTFVFIVPRCAQRTPPSITAVTVSEYSRAADPHLRLNVSSHHQKLWPGRCCGCRCCS